MRPIPQKVHPAGFTRHPSLIMYIRAHSGGSTRQNRAFRSNSSPPEYGGSGVSASIACAAHNPPSMADCELVEKQRSTAAFRHHAASRRAHNQRPPCRPSMADFELGEVRRSTAALRHHGAARRAHNQRPPCRPSMADVQLVVGRRSTATPRHHAASHRAAMDGGEIML